MFKAHANANRQAAFRATEKNTKATVDGQIKQITAYLAASVLADKISRLLQYPGSLLWLRLDSFNYTPQDKPVIPPKVAHSQTLSPNPSAHNYHMHYQSSSLSSYTLPLVKLAQGIHMRPRFLHIWLISK